MRLPFSKPAALVLGLAALTATWPVLLALGCWMNQFDFDVEAALSWEDLERDLWPGLGPE